MNFVHQSIFICRNESFQAWVMRNNFSWHETEPEHIAREFILRNCKIKSRAELADNLDAQQCFLKLKAQFERDRVGRAA
jgi:uncharacterized protein (DUF1697 family)